MSSAVKISSDIPTTKSIGKHIGSIMASSKDNVPILCSNKRQKDIMIRLANELKMPIPEPITMNDLTFEIMNKEPDEIIGKPFIINDKDNVLNTLLKKLFREITAEPMIDDQLLIGDCEPEHFTVIHLALNMQYKYNGLKIIKTNDDGSSIFSIGSVEEAGNIPDELRDLPVKDILFQKDGDIIFNV